MLVQQIKSCDGAGRHQRENERNGLAGLEFQTRCALRELVLEKVKKPNRVGDGRPGENPQERNGNGPDELLPEQVIIGNKKNGAGKSVCLENLVAATFKDKIIEKETAEDKRRRCFFPCVQADNLEKENQLENQIENMQNVHRAHQVCMRRLDAEKRKEQVYQKKREYAENTEFVIARCPKVRGKILGYVVVKGTVVADPVVERNLFAR